MSGTENVLLRTAVRNKNGDIYDRLFSNEDIERFKRQIDIGSFTRFTMPLIAGFNCSPSEQLEFFDDTWC